MASDRPVRVGIDVGGTFTHAVALDAVDCRGLAKARVPTTHTAPEGVARGVVEALERILREGGIAPADIAFLAHSTTQATNALLEGDVARVGILSLGKGLEGRKAHGDTDLRQLELPAGSAEVLHEALETPEEETLADALRAAVLRLRERGAQVIVVAEPFSVEDPAHERAGVETARAEGLLATGTHEVSGLYGLRARTRTSAINASILPKMMAAAEATERAVRAEGVTAPLMIVRSDGGVMSADEVARRPILTLLSGPAAGVAAAVAHIGLADGVFLEVGGTSTDISAIVDGRPLVRTASVGGHRLHLRTLDIETIALAGGSMPRVRAGALVDVGPRSAHIAGLAYYSFDADARPSRVEVIAPLAGDPAEYAILTDEDRRWAFTLTCARRTLEGDCPELGAELLGASVGLSARELAGTMLRIAGERAARTASEVADRAGLSGARRRLVGGGGGCRALLPSVAEALASEWHECEDAEVISAIGVARALLRESVERNIGEADEAALRALRQEAFEAVVRMGGDPERIEVRVEVDQATGVARAVASGPAELDASTQAEVATEGELEAAARACLQLPEGATVRLVGRCGDLTVWSGELRGRGLLARLRAPRTPIAVLDSRARVRLERGHARTVATTASQAPGELSALAEYGDHGARLPATQAVAGGRVTDLSGLSDPEQAARVLREELSALPDETLVILVRG